MNIQGMIIDVDGSTKMRTIEGAPDIREAVGGDFDWTSPGVLNYYCYEYALYERPFNVIATKLYQETHHTTDVLCGPVLVTGPVVNEDDTDTPREWINKARQLRQDIGQDEIDRQAVPLPAEEQLRIMTQAQIAQDTATAALERGQGVDFGGVAITPREQGEPVILGDVLSQLFGEKIDGNRRQGEIK